MNDKQFIKAVRKLGKATGVPVLLENKGKGGHRRLHYGDAFTTVQTGEIPNGTLHAMCKQIGIKVRDL